MEKSITAKENDPSFKRVKLKFIGGERSGDAIIISKEVFFIGRSQNNDLSIANRSISRRHAVINFSRGVYTVSDLNSVTGVLLNNKKISESSLKNGDRLDLGGAVLEFVEEGVSIVRRPKYYYIFFAIFASVVIIFIAVMFFTGTGKEAKLELNSEIDYYYQQGIKAFNVDKSMESARTYWEKVLELDPMQKTVQGHNSSILLNNLPSNDEGAESR